MALLLNVTDRGEQSIVIAIVGALMISYVQFGGMKGTTWVQIIKAVLVIAGVIVLTVMILARFDFNLSNLLGAAQASISGSSDPVVAARHVLNPGEQYGASGLSKLDFISLGMALVLGTAGLPHVLMARTGPFSPVRAAPGLPAPASNRSRVPVRTPRPGRRRSHRPRPPGRVFDRLLTPQQESDASADIDRADHRQSDTGGRGVSDGSCRLSEGNHDLRNRPAKSVSLRSPQLDPVADVVASVRPGACP